MKFSAILVCNWKLHTLITYVQVSEHFKLTRFIVGSIFLVVCLIRHVNYHFTTTQHVGLECGIWYWHFVDGADARQIFNRFLFKIWVSIFDWLPVISPTLWRIILYFFRFLILGNILFVGQLNNGTITLKTLIKPVKFTRLFILECCL